MSEVVPLLPHTDCLQQVEEYVRGWITSTTYWLLWYTLQLVEGSQYVVEVIQPLTYSSTCWRQSVCGRSGTTSVSLLPHTDCLQQVEEYVRGCTTSTTYWPPSTSWRVCQRLYHFYHILTAFNKLKSMSYSSTCWRQSVCGRSDTTSDILFNLPSTSWRVCQRLYHFYHILTAFNKLKSMSEVESLLPHTDCLQQVEEYVRGCTTSTTYWLPSTSWRVCQR
jgi:hypothetical protein